jgi:hypothetical protein
MKNISECESFEEWAMSFSDDEFKEFVADKFGELSMDLRNRDFNIDLVLPIVESIKQAVFIRYQSKDPTITNH